MAGEKDGHTLGCSRVYVCVCDGRTCWIMVVSCGGLILQFRRDWRSFVDDTGWDNSPTSEVAGAGPNSFHCRKFALQRKK